MKSANQQFFEGKSEDQLEFGRKFLLSGGCLRCLFSVYGQQNFKRYRASDNHSSLIASLMATQTYVYHQDFQRVISPDSEILTHEQKICRSCFGILQYGESQSFAQLVAKGVQCQDFQYQDFRFNIKGPIFVHLMRLKLVYEAQHGLQNLKLKPNKFIEFKDVLKMLSSHLVAEIIKSKANLNSNFGVNIDLQHESYDYAVCSEIMKLSERGQAIKRKKKFNQKKSHKEAPVQYGFQAVMSAASKLPKIMFQSLDFFKNVKSVNLLEQQFAKITCSYEPVLIAGRYLKYSRALAQTPWSIDGEVKGEGSVSQQIAQQILPVALPTEHFFHAGGRQDIDVRMLGNGRPFIVELVNCRRVFDLEKAIVQLESKVNSSSELVQVRSLRIVENEEFQKLKESQDTKIKRYCCIVWVARPLTSQDQAYLESLKDIKLAQKTPIRVLHRRSLLSRQKVIHSMALLPLTKHHFELHLISSAGTYIKEFIHGDLGRTQPNIGSLLKTKADILQLDVTGVFTEEVDSIIYQDE